MSKNFKLSKNREDGSDLDENLTKSITTMKTVISKKFISSLGGKTMRICAKTSRKLRGNVRKNLSNTFEYVAIMD